MSGKRKITVSTSIRFEGMAMDSTDAALEIVKSVLVSHSEQCKEEIARALEEAGAQDVFISMTAY